MKKAFEDNIKKTEELEDKVLTTVDVLQKIMNHQISLELQLQYIIKSNMVNSIAINSASKISLMQVDQIIYCKANLSYTEIVSLNDDDITATKTINEFECQLRSFSFFRISKSLLINVNHIHSFDKKNCQVLMKNNDLLDVARRRKAIFIDVLLHNS